MRERFILFFLRQLLSDPVKEELYRAEPEYREVADAYVATQAFFMARDFHERNKGKVIAFPVELVQ